MADELFLQAFAELARLHGAELDALIAENLFLDAQRSRRWTGAACRAMVEADAGNAKVLRNVLAQHRPTGQKMIDAGSRLLARHAPASRAADVADRVSSGWEAFLAQTGIGARA